MRGGGWWWWWQSVVDGGGGGGGGWLVAVAMVVVVGIGGGGGGGGWWRVVAVGEQDSNRSLRDDGSHASGMQEAKARKTSDGKSYAEQQNKVEGTWWFEEQHGE
ncbi:hypothetical protein NE237_010195 [Protea cynaroides]|uniref:Uncharacterized protein n=1 Tax=Protea cynaroides TaxID=273540 RepID=A0A9Q0KZC2_9MAGN|nr:hypothetical protein NE237_010195 [Protea cynaroides]